MTATIDAFYAREAQRRASPEPEPGFVHGRAAGRQDALLRVEPLTRAAWWLLHDFRRSAARFSREDPAHHAHRLIAERHAWYLRELLAIRRALKGGIR